MKTWKCHILALNLTFFTIGCAGPQTYLLRVGIDPGLSPSLPQDGKTLSVSLAPFQDLRTENELGTRTRQGIKDTYLPEGSLSTVFTDRIEEWFSNAGFSVRRIPSWDFTPDSLKGFSTDLVVGGKIDEFKVNTTSKFANHTTSVKCLFHFVIGNTRDRSIITQKIESSSEATSASSSLHIVEKVISDALSQGLSQVRLP